MSVSSHSSASSGSISVSFISISVGLSGLLGHRGCGFAGLAAQLVPVGASCVPCLQDAAVDLP